MRINVQYARVFLGRVERVVARQTCPTLFKNILQELKLDSFSTRDEHLSIFLEKTRNTPIDTTALIDNVKSTLLQNTSLCDLLAFIEENNLISNEEISAASETLNLQVHLLVLFEAFGVTMANSPTLAEDVYQHIVSQRTQFYPGNPIATFLFGAPKEASLFERLKLISVDPGMTACAFRKASEDKTETKQTADIFRRKYGLSLWNANFNKARLPIEHDAVKNVGLNILEAAWEEGNSGKTGSHANAATGMALIALAEHYKYLARITLVRNILPENVSVQADFKYPLLPDLALHQNATKVDEFHVSTQWRDLYNSWNLLFVISQLDSVFLPIKLLAPSVLSAQPAFFLESRIMLLFFMGNLFLGQKTEKNPFFRSTFNFSNASIIANQWGIINQKYADQLLKPLSYFSERNSEKLYQDCFGKHANISLFKNVGTFVLSKKTFTVTAHAKEEVNGVSVAQLQF